MTDAVRNGDPPGGWDGDHAGHALRHGPDAALATHLRRTAELETEDLSRHPGREVDPSRLTQAL